VRDVFLEETTVLNARNEELAQLSAQYIRRMDGVPGGRPRPDAATGKNNSFDKHRPSQQSVTMPPLVASSTLRASNYTDDLADPGKSTKAQKHDTPEFPTPSSKRNFIKWPGSKAKEITQPTSDHNSTKAKPASEHVFQQYSLLRFTRCDHCGDKMWGSQVRCSRTFEILLSIKALTKIVSQFATSLFMGGA
jgi:Rho-type GTPase-activating protein 1/2